MLEEIGVKEYEKLSSGRKSLHEKEERKDFIDEFKNKKNVLMTL